MEKPLHLDITFYYDGAIYRYLTDLYKNKNILDNILFKNEKLY